MALTLDLRGQVRPKLKNVLDLRGVISEYNIEKIVANLKVRMGVANT